MTTVLSTLVFIEPPPAALSNAEFDIIILHRKAFNVIKTAKLHPKWRTIAELLEVPNADLTQLYILYEFSGNAYDHLFQLKCRIVSPLVILQSHKYRLFLPMRTNPTWAQSLRRKIVCSIGFEADEQTQIKDKVIFLGGRYKKTIDNNVAVILVGDFNPNDSWVQVAAEKNILILKKKWLEDVYQSAINLEVECANFSEPDFLLQYQVIAATSSIPQNHYFGSEVEHVGQFEDLFRSDARSPAINNTPIQPTIPKSQRRQSNLRPEISRFPTNNDARPLRQSAVDLLRRDTPTTISRSSFNPVMTSTRNDKKNGKSTAKHVLGRRKPGNDSSSTEYLGVSLKLQISRKRPSIIKKIPSSYPSSETSSTKKKNDKRKVATVRPLFENLQQTPITDLNEQTVLLNDNVERAANVPAQNLSFYAENPEGNQDRDIFMDDEERELLTQFSRR